MEITLNYFRNGQTSVTFLRIKIQNPRDMKIKKAVITAAARGERLYPVADTVQKAMLPIVDRDGLTKPAIQIIAEEAFAAGVEEIAIVCAPGDEQRYRQNFERLQDNLLKAYKNVSWAKTEAGHIDHLQDRLHFCVQEETLGYGHAVLQAKSFVNEEPFLLLLGDHLYVSDDEELNCAKQLIGVAEQQQQSVTAVNRTPEHLIHKYGTLTGNLIPERNGLYQVGKIIEKPSLSQAELELELPHIRMGYYLCVFGMHVLQPVIFDILESQLNSAPEKDLALTPALQILAERQAYLAMEVKGRRFDLSETHGVLQAELALGLAGQQKEELLATLLRLVAEQ